MRSRSKTAYELGPAKSFKIVKDPDSDNSGVQALLSLRHFGFSTSSSVATPSRAIIQCLIIDQCVALFPFYYYTSAELPEARGSVIGV